MAGGSGPAPIFLVLTALAVVLAIVFLLFADVLLIGLFGRSSLDAATGGSASTSASTPASTSASNVSAISDLLLQEEKRQQQLRQQQEDKEKLPLLTLLVLSANVPAAHAPLIVPPANDAAAVGGAGDGAAAAAAAPQELSEASSAAAGGGAGTAEAEAGGLVSKGDSSGSSSSSSSGSSSGSSSSSSSGSHAGLIPVVLFLRGNPGCNRGRYMQASLRQALLLNTWLILIGPRACSQEMGEMGVELEVYEDYEGNSGIEERFVTEIGKVMAYHVRWFFLYEMMVRRNISRVFYTDNDVLLFVNVTQFVQSHLPEAKLSLAMRSNSVRIRAVSGHVSLWSQEALADFLAFFILFFQQAVAGGKPGDPSLPSQRAYNDMVLLGWYVSHTCWTSAPDQLPKTCKDKEKSSQYPRLHGKFTPAFKAVSLCAPRQCQATAWSDPGWCAFDNNFSLTGKRKKFHFCPKQAMKIPTSVHYEYFKPFVGRQQNKGESVQFLAVHFQGRKKAQLKDEDPCVTWGSSRD